MLFSLLIAAAPATPLPPSGLWNVHAETSYCILSRPYGTDVQRIEVAFQPSIGNGSMTLMVITPPRGNVQEIGEAQITRQPDGQKLTGRYYSVVSSLKGAAAGKKRMTQIWLGNDIFAALDSTTALRIKAYPIDVAVAVGRSDKAKQAFRKCEDGLLESWGIAPATVREGISPEPKRNIADYFRWEDYPAVARNAGYVGHVGHVGHVRAALVVGADGQVKDCRVVTRIGAAFDKITCERARLVPFTPGLDRNGAPAQSLYQLNVRWTMD